jgi:hypothetical protein
MSNSLKEITLSENGPFATELMALIVKHNLESIYGIPVHIIHQIMTSSFDNYCHIFRNLENFYMQIEEERRNQPLEVSDETL